MTTTPAPDPLPAPYLPRDETEALAQHLAAWDAAVDLEQIQAEWPEWNRWELLAEAGKFIRLHDALLAYRAGRVQP
jgi:hypothetical protein